MKKISNAELEVMKIIWNKKITTSLEIIEELNSEKWNHNTIRTLIKRLLKKDAIQIREKEGKVYKYMPKIDEREYKHDLTKRLINQLFHGSLEEMIICMVKEDAKYKKEIEELREMLE